LLQQDAKSKFESKTSAESKAVLTIADVESQQDTKSLAGLLEQHGTLIDVPRDGSCGYQRQRTAAIREVGHLHIKIYVKFSVHLMKNPSLRIMQDGFA
jgi:hypothetical protein